MGGKGAKIIDMGEKIVIGGLNRGNKKSEDQKTETSLASWTRSKQMMRIQKKIGDRDYLAEAGGGRDDNAP